MKKSEESKRESEISILFVCHGNICRSPAAEGTFIHLLKKKNLENHFRADSAGVASYHIGELPHQTTRKVALEYGIQLVHRARQFRRSDFDEFDLILAMDRSNLSDMLRSLPQGRDSSHVKLFRTYDPSSKKGENTPDVPDPYYGGIDGFFEVQEIMLRTCEALLEELKPEA